MTTQTKDPYVAFLESELKKKSSGPKKKKVKTKKRKTRKKVVSKSKQKKTNYTKTFAGILSRKDENQWGKFVADLREQRNRLLSKCIARISRKRGRNS